MKRQFDIGVISIMKTWFITGATGGLATAVIKQLLENGDRVAVTSRKEGAFDDLKKQYGDQLWQSPLDLSDEDDVKRTVNEAINDLGKIDVLLNNAAYGLYGAIEEISELQMKDVFEINLFGSLRTAKAFLPHFRKQDGGQIIQISSMAGHYSTPAMGMYSASKWAVEAAFEALSQEVAPFNIRVTIVDPGGIRTNFVGGNGAFGDRLSAYDNTPTGKITDIMQNGLTGASQTEIDSYLKTIAGDPQKMATKIVSLTQTDTPPLRIVLGSDAFQKIHSSLISRIHALEENKTLSWSTDADDYTK